MSHFYPALGFIFHVNLGRIRIIKFILLMCYFVKWMMTEGSYGILGILVIVLRFYGVSFKFFLIEVFKNL